MSNTKTLMSKMKRTFSVSRVKLKISNLKSFHQVTIVFLKKLL